MQFVCNWQLNFSFDQNLRAEFNMSQGLTGQEWYQLEASRAVNQAIGRIIRHRNDYGAVILCDCRFENPNFKKQLSAWLRPYVKRFTNFGMITKELREFFRNAESTVTSYSKFDCNSLI